MLTYDRINDFVKNVRPAHLALCMYISTDYVKWSIGNTSDRGLEVPGSIPSSGKEFILLFSCCVFTFIVRNSLFVMKCRYLFCSVNSSNLLNILQKVTDYKGTKNPRFRPTCSIFKYALTLQCLILSTIKDNKTKHIWLIYSMFE